MTIAPWIDRAVLLSLTGSDQAIFWHKPVEASLKQQQALFCPGPYAQDFETLAQQELRRLLRGTPAQQDLLGLLTGARGGLSGPDLATPVGDRQRPARGVRVHFTRRMSTWQPEAGPEVYLLGHEELQATARHTSAMSD